MRTSRSGLEVRFPTVYPMPSWIAPLIADDAVYKGNTGCPVSLKGFDQGTGSKLEGEATFSFLFPNGRKPGLSRTYSGPFTMCDFSYWLWNAPHRLMHLNTWPPLLFWKDVEPMEDGPWLVNIGHQEAHILALLLVLFLCLSICRWRVPVYASSAHTSFSIFSQPWWLSWVLWNQESK